MLSAVPTGKDYHRQQQLS